MRQLLLDRVGISLSGLCVLHCLLLPVLLALLPMWGLGEAVHAWLHPVFAVVLVPTTFLAAAVGFARHESFNAVGLLAAGLTAIVVAGFLGHDRPGTVVETAITVLGSALLIAGHIVNWRLGVRQCAPTSLVSDAS